MSNQGHFCNCDAGNYCRSLADSLCAANVFVIDTLLIAFWRRRQLFLMRKHWRSPLLEMLLLTFQVRRVRPNRGRNEAKSFYTSQSHTMLSYHIRSFLQTEKKRSGARSVEVNGTERANVVQTQLSNGLLQKTLHKRAKWGTRVMRLNALADRPTPSLPLSLPPTRGL